MRTLLLLLVSLGGFAAETRPRNAPLHPTVSARQVCLNQLVQVTFVTLKPQVDGVDAEQVIRTALSLPSVGKHWRVVGRPKVGIDERIKTLKVSYQLLPRHSGELDLPEIPVRWLPGNTVGRMGEVEVLDKIRVGPETQDPPNLIHGVAGYSWGASLDEIEEKTGKKAAKDAATGAVVITPKANLDLIFKEKAFGTARLHVPDMALPQARQAFLEQWGDPIGEVTTDHGSAITWMCGWIRVEAHGMGAGTIVYVIHEEIASRLARAAVERKVFNVLEGGGELTPPKETPKEGTPSRGEDPAKTPAERPKDIPDPKKVELELDDFQKEWERNLKDKGGVKQP